MTGTESFAEVLEKASRGRCVILSRRDCRGFDSVSLAELKDTLREMGDHTDTCSGDASAEIFGAAAAELGHASAWIDAGLVYEGFADTIQSNGVPDTVFCLDPWAAQLRSRAGEIAPRATWILQSDLDDRKGRERREYWEQLEEWFKSLSFSAIFPKSAWDEVLAPSGEPPPRSGAPELFAQKPGAWRWRRLTAPPQAASVILLSRYSGSLSHLRVLLDSVVRQEGAREGTGIVILAGDEGEDPRTYLKWFEIAHPRQPASLIRTAGDWKADLNRVLGKAPSAVVVMAGDHAVLPAGFLGTVRRGACPAIVGIPASLEASAHILTGNLDAVQKYETLLASFFREGKARPDAARVVAAETWNDRSVDPASRLLEIARERREEKGGAPLFLLELADLP